MATFKYSDEHGMVMDEIPADRGRLYVRVMPRAITPRNYMHLREVDLVGYKAIHHAAARGDVPLLQRLIAVGQDKNAIQEPGMVEDPDVKWTLDDRIYRIISGATPLHLAAFYGHVNAVQALIEAGASVNVFASARAGENIDRGYVTPVVPGASRRPPRRSPPPVHPRSANSTPHHPRPGHAHHRFNSYGGHFQGVATVTDEQGDLPRKLLPVERD